MSDWCADRGVVVVVVVVVVVIIILVVVCVVGCPWLSLYVCLSGKVCVCCVWLL